jgi:uncharacterized membrane protein (UPF0127 family)
MFWPLSNQRAKALGCVLLLALAVPACVRRAPAPPLVAKTVQDWFPIKVGDQTVQMQLAVFSAEMEHGLMERRELAGDQGMLFVYREPTQMSFWMRNTPLPLDIGFFGSGGELREIYSMLPFDETAIRSRSNALEYALEMNRGWFHDHGVKPGAMLDLKSLREALKARGLAPEDFGLR